MALSCVEDEDMWKLKGFRSIEVEETEVCGD